MIDKNRLLGVVPARGGSRGIPRKNLREVLGRPLVAWTILEAQKSRYLDRLILSSDDPEIVAVAQDLGCEVPFLRPAWLAQDGTPGIEPILHALRELPGYDYVVALQPTSPLRTVEDIDGCILRCVRSGSSSCVTVTECREHPCLMARMNGGFKLQPLLPEVRTLAGRQEYPRYYRLNGAVYIAETHWLQTTRSFLAEGAIGYEMPLQRSLDVDTESDLESLNFQAAQRS